MEFAPCFRPFICLFNLSRKTRLCTILHHDGTRAQTFNSMVHNPQEPLPQASVHSDHLRQVLPKQVLARLLIKSHLAFTKTMRYFFSRPESAEDTSDGTVVLLHLCAKPFVVLVGMAMFFNSMNLDNNHGGRHFGSRFLIFFVSETSSFPLTRLISTAYV